VAIFIAHAPAERGLAERLSARLREIGRDVAASPADADALIFILSPDSCASRECTSHLAAAKRIVPVVAIEPQNAPPEVAALNWLFFGDTDDFEAAFAQLVYALDTDLEWVRAHAQLEGRAYEWNSKRDKSLLLRGAQLDDAEGWLAAGMRNPAPSPLQAAFTLASRQAITRRRRTFITTLAAISVVMLVLAAAALFLRSRAVDREHLATARGLAAAATIQIDTDPQLALILGLRAWDARHTPEAEEVIRRAVEVNRELETFQSHAGSVFGVSFSPDGGTLASCGDDGMVRLWRVSDGEIVREWDTGQVKVSTVEFSPDGVVLATSGSDGTVRLWDAESGEAGEVLRAAGQDKSVNLVTFSNEDLLAAGTSDGFVRVWDITNTEHVTSKEFGGDVTALAFAPNGTTLAIGSDDGRSMLWEVPTGGFEEIRHSYENLDALDVAPDEPYLAYAGWGNDVVAFDVSRNEIAKKFRSANDRGRAVRFSPDGKQVAAAGDSPGVVVNWLESVGKTRDPLVLLGHHGSTWGLDYAPDGKTIASAGADGSVRIWDVDPDDDADEIKDASDLSTDELLALARARVSRELTDEEAAVFIEGRGVAGSSGG
jgi:hypothetical protein